MCLLKCWLYFSLDCRILLIFVLICILFVFFSRKGILMNKLIFYFDKDKWQVFNYLEVFWVQEFEWNESFFGTVLASCKSKQEKKLWNILNIRDWIKWVGAVWAFKMLVGKWLKEQTVGFRAAYRQNSAERQIDQEDPGSGGNGACEDKWQ